MKQARQHVTFVANGIRRSVKTLGRDPRGGILSGTNAWRHWAEMARITVSVSLTRCRTPFHYPFGASTLPVGELVFRGEKTMVTNCWTS